MDKYNKAYTIKPTHKISLSLRKHINFIRKITPETWYNFTGNKKALASIFPERFRPNKRKRPNNTFWRRFSDKENIHLNFKLPGSLEANTFVFTVYF